MVAHLYIYLMCAMAQFSTYTTCQKPFFDRRKGQGINRLCLATSASRSRSSVVLKFFLET